MRVKYVVFCRDLRNLWDIKETVIPIVIGTLELSPKVRKECRRARNQRKN